MAKTTTKTDAASKAPANGVPVVVTTEHKGVFFGYMNKGHSKDVLSVRLERARMCVYWSAEMKGVVGLAATGPNHRCKIGPAAPAITLQKVTSIMECSPEATRAWEEGAWN